MPESDQRANLRRSLRRRFGRRNRHRHNGCGGGGQDAGNQRDIARRFLIAIADIGIIDAGLIRQLIADGAVLRQFLFVVANPAQGIRRRLHMRIRHDHQGNLVARFDLIELFALLVHEIGGNINRHLRNHAAGPLLARLFTDQTQQGQRHRFHAAYGAHAAAARTVDMRRLAQGRS